MIQALLLLMLVRLVPTLSLLMLLFTPCSCHCACRFCHQLINSYSVKGILVLLFLPVL